MESSSNLYDRLGVAKDATLKEIKKAYRDLSKIHHPDKGGDEEIFKLISEAYNILSDEDMRKIYDEGGSLEALKDEANGLMNRVFSIFEEAINSSGFVPDHVDLFKKMRGVCNEKELKMEKDMSSLKGEIRNVEAIQGRLVNADIFKDYLNNKISDHNKSIGNIEKEKGFIRQILSFIENCSYDYEEDNEDIHEPLNKFHSMFS